MKHFSQYHIFVLLLVSFVIASFNSNGSKTVFDSSTQDDVAVNATPQKNLVDPLLKTNPTARHSDKTEDQVCDSLVFLLKEGYNLLLADKPTQASLLLRKADSLAISCNDTLQLGKAKLMLGAIQYGDYAYKEAIKDWKVALHLFKAIGDTINYSKASSNLVSAFLQLGYYGSAYDYFANSIAALPESLQNEEPGHIAILNIGVVLLENEQYAEAKTIFNNLLSGDVTPHVRLLSYINLANIGIELGAFNDVEQYISDLEELIPAYGIYQRDLIRLKLRSLIQQDQLEQAKNLIAAQLDSIRQTPSSNYYYFDIINDYEEKGGVPFVADSFIINLLRKKDEQINLTANERLNANEIRHRRLAARGDYKAAYEAMRESDSLLIAVVDSQKQAVIYDFQERYQSDIKSERIAILSTELRLKARVAALFIGISGLLFILLAIIIRFYRRQQQLYRSLYLKNIELTSYFEQNSAENKSPDKKGVRIEHVAEDIEVVIWSRVTNALVKDRVFTNADLKLEDLARICGTNRTYLNNSIKRFTSGTFLELLTKYRVEAAKKVLSQKAYVSLADVGIKAGFNSKSTFYRLFKAETGLSPGEYAKEVK